MVHIEVQSSKVQSLRSLRQLSWPSIVTSPDVGGTGTSLRCGWLRGSLPLSRISTSYERGACVRPTTVPLMRVGLIHTCCPVWRGGKVWVWCLRLNVCCCCSFNIVFVCWISQNQAAVVVAPLVSLGLVFWFSSPSVVALGSSHTTMEWPCRPKELCRNLPLSLRETL